MIRLFHQRQPRRISEISVLFRQLLLRTVHLRRCRTEIRCRPSDRGLHVVVLLVISLFVYPDSL